MPRVGDKLILPHYVQCPNCSRAQPDHGKGQTCEKCGCSPLPSFMYPEDSAFYPKKRIIPPKQWKKV